MWQCKRDAHGHNNKKRQNVVNPCSKEHESLGNDTTWCRYCCQWWRRQRADAQFQTQPNDHATMTLTFRMKMNMSCSENPALCRGNVGRLLHWQCPSNGNVIPSVQWTDTNASESSPDRHEPKPRPTNKSQRDGNPTKYYWRTNNIWNQYENLYLNIGETASIPKLATPNCTSNIPKFNHNTEKCKPTNVETMDKHGANEKNAKQNKQRYQRQSTRQNLPTGGSIPIWCIKPHD